MPDFENLLTNLQDGILTITVDREPKLNALNLATLDELREVIQEIYDNPLILGAIITGAGPKAFVAGADISEIARLNHQEGLRFAKNGQEIFQMIEDSPKPVIAAVNGFALGGGCELAMACHLRVALPGAKFGQPEVNLGIIPGYGGTQRLTHLIGKSRAMEMMMTGEMISAEQASNFGLVSHLADNQEEMMDQCKTILQKIFTKAPLAIGMVIKCVNAVYQPTVSGYKTEAESFSECCKTEDFKEGTSAFMDKRPPNFQGK
jgi:enoyl-CoA hydratase